MNESDIVFANTEVGHFCSLNSDFKSTEEEIIK